MNGLCFALHDIYEADGRENEKHIWKSDCMVIDMYEYMNIGKGDYMNTNNHRKYNAQYRLVYDYGEGPVVIYEAYDEQDAIQEKKRRIERDGIYPIIFCSDKGRHFSV